MPDHAPDLAVRRIIRGAVHTVYGGIVFCLAMSSSGLAYAIGGLMFFLWMAVPDILDDWFKRLDQQ